MKYILHLRVILFLTVLPLTGQTYSSEFEKAIFTNFKKDSINYNFIESIFAIDSNLTKENANIYEEKILKLLSNLPEKEEKPKKEKKRVRLIYDHIHDSFFKKYNLDSYFSDIFIDGTYNCVTASAMYAYVFNELKIPYHIKETPSHVFLIAYPKTLNIYLETTAPGAYGFSAPQESEIQKIIDELIAYKLVTQAEVDEKGTMQFYEDYYYGKDYIDKSSLIGMQYYNKGLTHLSKNEYDKALNNLLKAKVFYSSPLIKPILKSIMFNKINELEFNSQEDIDFLIELLSISKYPGDYTITNLKSSLYKIIEHDDNSNEFIEETINKIQLLDSEKVRNEAAEFLYEYLARNNANDENLDDALKYSDSILEINSKSKVAQQIVEYVCFKKVGLSMLDLNALESFNDMADKYDFIKSNNRYNIGLAHFYCNIAFMNYKSKSISIAQDYREKFENLMDNHDLINEMNQGLISNLYLKAGNYHYYKEHYQSSYNIYTKGLNYIPGHPELTKKAEWSKEELK